MVTVDEDWRILSGMLPPEWRTLARTTGAVKRLRGFDSMDAVLRTLLLHAGQGWSLRETAVQAKLAGIAEVSDVALMDRLRLAEPWLRGLCEGLWKANGVSLEPGFNHRVVRLLDATTVREPGKTGSQWRIHYSLRLPSLECDHFELTPARGKDTGEKLGRFSFRQGELVLADAGYSHPPGIAAVATQKAELCLRLNPASVPLFDLDLRPFPLATKLRLLAAGEIGDWPVRVVWKRQKISGRVCALRKSEAAIARAQRRIDQKQIRKTSKGSAEAREYACYVMVFTTLPPNEADGARVLECYRLRWQIELTFKRLKSILQLGHVPKQDDASSRAWLYAKLLVALLAERLATVGSAISPWGYYLDAVAQNS
jgi:transposase